MHLLNKKSVGCDSSAIGDSGAPKYFSFFCINETPRTPTNSCLPSMKILLENKIDDLK